MNKQTSPVIIKMKKLSFCTFFLNFVVLTISIVSSPCPKFFAYEARNQSSDRWYGTVTLATSEKLSGVVLRLKFDRKALQLGNWFGEVSTSDRKEYVIRNENFVLKPGVTKAVRFYVTYKANATPPRLISISINGNYVCSREELNFHPPPATQDEDDYYPSDFSFINRSKIANEVESICGTVIGRPRPLITYGEPSLEGEFPWHVAIYHAKDFDLTYICGGSLLSKSFVITVAHCVTKAKSTATFNVDNLVVYLGKYYLRQFSNVGIQERSLSMIILHPEFNPHTFSNDLALLRFEKAVEYTDYVRPICLWEDDKDLARVIRKKGKVVGWGYDESGKITDELMEISMPIVSQETCVTSFPQFYTRFTSSRTYCAGYRNGSSVCNGDSGGGMVFPKRSDSSVFQLRGLVSISIALRNQFCDTSHYVVFTDTTKYLDWINNIITIK